MKKRNQAPGYKSKAAPTHKAVRRWPIYLLMLIFAVVIVSGFFLAGRQHFSSMDYGMKNSKLSRQIEALEAEKRRLLLAREVSLSPSEIMRAAKKIGLVDGSESSAISARAASPAPVRAIPAAAAAQKSMVVKTAAVSPAGVAPRPAAALYSKPEKQVKRSIAAE